MVNSHLMLVMEFLICIRKTKKKNITISGNPIRVKNVELGANNIPTICNNELNSGTYKAKEKNFLRPN